MNALHLQQQALQAAILTERFPEHLLAPGLGDVERRFAVYAHAYRARLCAALRDNYPVLHQVLGDGDFDALALAYLVVHPSAHPSIRWFGGNLESFVRAHPEHAAHPAVGDLIRLEWALRSAFDALDQPLLESAHLAALAPEDWPGLVLRPQASVRLLDLEWSVEALWRAVDRGEAEVPEPELAPHRLLVWRKALTPCWRRVDAGEAALIEGLLLGDDFAALCARAATGTDDPHGMNGEDACALRVVQALQQWIADGLLGVD